MESKKIRDLIEAYSSIYESNCGKEEAEQIDEADSIAAMRERAAKRRKQRYGASDTSRGGRDDFRPYTKADYERGEANDPRKKTNEEVDIFDTILEHLVAEGYADTNEAALAIMANMSEEWKQSIVEASEEDKARLQNYEIRYYQKHGGMPADPEKRKQLRDAARKLPPA